MVGTTPAGVALFYPLLLLAKGICRQGSQCLLQGSPLDSTQKKTLEHGCTSTLAGAEVSGVASVGEREVGRPGEGAARRLTMRRPWNGGCASKSGSAHCS